MTECLNRAGFKPALTPRITGVSTAIPMATSVLHKSQLNVQGFWTMLFGTLGLLTLTVIFEPTSINPDNSVHDAHQNARSYCAWRGRSKGNFERAACAGHCNRGDCGLSVSKK